MMESWIRVLDLFQRETIATLAPGRPSTRARAPILIAPCVGTQSAPVMLRLVVTGRILEINQLTINVGGCDRG